MPVVLPWMLVQAEDSDLVLLTIVVRADLRRQSIGDCLFDKVRQQAGQLASQRIVADVGTTNSSAWAFFKRQGFQKSPGSPNDASYEVVLNMLGTSERGFERPTTAGTNSKSFTPAPDQVPIANQAAGAPSHFQLHAATSTGSCIAASSSTAMTCNLVESFCSSHNIPGQALAPCGQGNGSASSAGVAHDMAWESTANTATMPMDVISLYILNFWKAFGLVKTLGLLIQPLQTAADGWIEAQHGTILQPRRGMQGAMQQLLSTFAGRCLLNRATCHGLVHNCMASVPGGDTALAAAMNPRKAHTLQCLATRQRLTAPVQASWRVQMRCTRNIRQPFERAIHCKHQSTAALHHH